MKVDHHSIIHWQFPFLGILLLIITCTSYGQKEFQGNVKDIETGTGIINATITYGDGKGAISDLNGKFLIDDLTFPAKLEISHLNYQPQTVIVRSIYESGLTIQLQPKQLDIDQVEVLGERITRFFPRKYFYALDYAFLNDKMVIIGYDQSRLNYGKLLLTNLSQDTLSARPISKPKGLFKDAFGNIHLFARDSVYQILLQNNKLSLIYPTHESDFLEVLKLQIADNHTFVFKDTYGDGQLHLYSRIDTITKKVDTIQLVYDHQKYPDSRFAQRHRQARLPQLTIDYMGQMDTTAAGVRAANRLFQSTYFDNFIIHNPIISLVFEYGNDYIIFDIANTDIHSVSMDSLKARTVTMDFPIHSKRVKYFVQDEFTKKIYWVYYHGNKVLLGEVDPATGKIVNQLETPSFPYIENIKIRNGEIWFLYQPRLGETVRSLYRMK
jgi:hypothetical protein